MDKDSIKSIIEHTYWCTGERIDDPAVYKRGLAHLRTITQHKNLVMKQCFQVGLYRQGLLHDLSKYSVMEFVPGMLFYQDGKRSPNNAEREALGLTKAWLHHKGRNKHHFEYWIDYSLPPDVKLKSMKMDDEYVVEMFMDRIAACKVYQGLLFKKESAWEYYDKSIVRNVLHPDTAKLLEHLLKMYAKYDEEATFIYIKEALRNGKKWEFNI